MRWALLVAVPTNSCMKQWLTDVRCTLGWYQLTRISLLTGDAAMDDPDAAVQLSFARVLYAFLS